METARKWAATVAVLMIGLAAMSEAADICGMKEEELSACKAWVTKPCPADPPPSACCECLSTADYECLCSYKDSLLLRSLGIDSDLALALPAKCGLSTTPSCA